MKSLSYHIATVLGLGDRLPAPGTTAGALPAIVGWWMAMVVLGSEEARLVATIAGVITVLIVGTWASAAESRRRGGEDPGPVVIDEVAGQWLSAVPALIMIGDQTPLSLGLAAIAAFFLFRFFDVVKPWPVSALERLPGGVGIMADDVGAGVLAAAVLALGLVLI
jgi:phosphatidylglycerophosphatase A